MALMRPSAPYSPGRDDSSCGRHHQGDSVTMHRNRFEGRLVRIEQYLKPVVCPTCHGRPSRLIGIDEETNEETSESMPESGCPACGRPVWREIHLVGVDVRSL